MKEILQYSEIKFILLVILILIVEILILKALKKYNGKLSYVVTPFSFLLINVIGVGFYFFCLENSPLAIDNKISLIETVIAFISVIIVFWGGYIAIQQLTVSAQANQESSQNNKLSSFQFMIAILQEDKARQSRKKVFSIYNETTREILPMIQWTEEQKDAVHYALTKIDEVGLLVKYNLLDYKFLEGWYYTIYKILFIGKELKEKEEELYSHRVSDRISRESNYYLGIAELLKKKDTNIDYDFENKSDNRKEINNI